MFLCSEQMSGHAVAVKLFSKVFLQSFCNSDKTGKFLQVLSSVGTIVKEM